MKTQSKDQMMSDTLAVMRSIYSLEKLADLNNSRTLTQC